MSIWTPVSPFVSTEIPGLLSGMGVINTVTVFVYSTALSRVSGIKYRRRTVTAFGAAWVATLMVVAAYVLHSYLGWNSGLLVDAGLVLWVLSFLVVLFLIYFAARDSVGRGQKSYERDWEFLDYFNRADFGVPAIDQVLRRSQRTRRVIYPFLLIHDINSPGLRVARAFARAGIRTGEAVIYLSFSRPYTTILQQMQRESGLVEQLWIIDCYSSLYMPEELRRDARNTLFADPRDPSDVYTKYMMALTACGRSYRSVRSIYETLSDFIKIADPDLVMHYLRRVVVLEERRNIRSLYLFWDKAVQGGVDQQYLRWFFTTTLEMTRPDTMTEPGVLLKMSRFFPQPVTVNAGPELQYDESSLFRVHRPRIARLSTILRRLSYTPVPYGFLPGIAGADRSMHLVNFLFFMVAIDHDTHRPGQRYEGEARSQFLHGSDLLYALAQRAKEENPQLFLPASFAHVGEETVARIFTTPDGVAPADLDGRAELFRDCAMTLNTLYEGDAQNLLLRANHHLGGTHGLSALLQSFAGYRDPVGKKSSLLAKVLIRENMFEAVDPEKMDVAIDHVVMTMALRSGMVACSDQAVRAAIAAGVPIDDYQMTILREVTRDAMRAAVSTSQIMPDRLDDLLWSYGRKSLRRPTPLDDPSAVKSELDSHLNVIELPRFIAFLNGIDQADDHCWPEALTVRGPFTRFY